MKMLMEIDPLPMRGSMVMISPSRREVSPAEQLRWGPRLVPPRGGGVSSQKLAYDFSSDERLHIEKDGHQRINSGAHEVGGRAQGGRAHPPPSWTVGGPTHVFLLLNIFY